MKYFLLLILLLSINLHAQNNASVKNIQKNFITYSYEAVTKWEGITKNNVLVFGVERSDVKAKAKIADFNSRNWGTNYRILHYTIKTDTISFIGKDDYFKLFKKRCVKGYCLLSMQEQIATDIYMREGLFEAINYYRKAVKTPYPSAKQHLENIIYNMSPYRINFQFNPTGQSH